MEKLGEFNISETSKVNEIPTEKIMEKVIDINMPGLGYSCVKETDIQSILKNGLLGVDVTTHSPGKSTEKEKWLDTVRKNSDPTSIYFNITDRSAPPGIYGRKAGKSIIDGSHWMQGTSYRKVNLALLFDVSGFKEITRKDSINKSARQRAGKFFDDLPDYLRDWPKNARGQTFTSTEYGFRLSNRVPPRKFKGLVIKLTKIVNRRSELFPEDEMSVDEDDKDKWSKSVSEIVKIMQDVLNQDNLVPVYDNEGNLLWPKQMAYQEVLKFLEDKKSTVSHNL